MEPKKTNRANIERRKGIYLQIGIIASLAIVLLAFEWKKYDKVQSNDLLSIVDDFEEEIIPITQRQEEPPPQKPPPQTTLLDIVEDDVIVEDDIIVDTEADQSSENQEYVPIDEPAEEEAVEEEIFTIVEEQPSYPGGDQARMKFLSENIVYPQVARETGIEGKVYITFVVEKDGRITNIKLLKDIGGGCGEEAIRVTKKMPKWLPGKQRGKSVRVQFNMPINFTLQ